MIFKPLNSSAHSGSFLQVGDGADLCCGNNKRFDYSVTVDTNTNGTASNIRIQEPGQTAATVALDGAPIDWSDSANDGALKAAIGKAATDAGYKWLGGGITLSRDGDNLTIKIMDSTLIFVWIGTTTTNENAITGTEVT